MKTILHLGVATLLLAGCHRSGSMQREQQEYQVVQEGSASGETSTALNAPGESAAVLPPTTNTNVDTTGTFAGFGTDTNYPTAQPGSLGGTLPPQTITAPAVATSYRPPRPTQTLPPPMTSATPATPVPPPTATAPAQTTAQTSTQTSTMAEPEPEPAPQTDTTTTQPPPEQEQQQDQQEEPPPPQPPSGTTASS